MDVLLDFWNSLPEIEKTRIFIGIATAVLSALVVALLRVLAGWLRQRIKRIPARSIPKVTDAAPLSLTSGEPAHAPAASAKSLRENPIGTTINNRYRLDSLLGRGAMGAVYRAYDLLLDRTVAVKVLDDTTAAPESSVRFLREARAVAQLSHPNIVSVFDAGAVGNVPFIVMELLEGKNLHAIESLSIPQVIDLARQICDALDRAHAQGILHRDLKPENIMIGREGERLVASLMDWGLARLRNVSRLTQEGVVVGTVAYMAPEQALGEEIDCRADLYALGVILYELTAGTMPFTGSDPISIISQHLYAPVVPPSTYRTDLPPALEAIILKLLAKNPEERYSSARAVAQALAEITAAGHALSRATTTDASTRETRPARRTSGRALSRATTTDAPLEFESGTFTFLFTDIEGSTRLWEQAPEEMRAAMARHDALIEQYAAQHAGHIQGARGEGDSRFIVFTRATDAVAAAAAMQEALRREPWHTPRPVRVRIALHTGEADLREGDFYGSDVNRCARIRALAHGGQTLLSQATRNLVIDALPDRLTLRDLGMHRLKDLQRPERVYQLDIVGVPADFPPLRSLDNLPNNLPVQLTSFVGREREIEKLKQQLSTAHLVTLTGTGGCGKTRLALQVAAGVLENFADGVWFVELAPLSDPLLVPQAIATALGVREAPGTPLNRTLADYVGQKSLLLILDNCEHLVEVCAELTNELLRACPNLRIVATSRQVLGIAGETPFRVPSLTLPDLRDLPSREDLMQYEAVRLFVERTSVVRPDWELTNPAAVAQICQRLDGIPLAIELAAPRVKVMTVEQIAARLDDRFRLLTGGSRTALPRQQTLRALIDWSYDLLTEEERIFLQRLSVFIGGASLEAVETLCAGRPTESYDLLDVLTHLVDKSLVMVEEQNGEARYRMLETIRQYAQGKLQRAGESAQMHDCHRDYFLRLVEEGEAHLRGAQQLQWLNRLETEYDNILAALERSQTAADAEACLRFGGALWLFWNVRGYWTEGRERLAKILALPDAAARTRARARALVGAAFLALLQGDYGVARALFEESLAIGKEVDGKREIAYSLDGLGSITQSQGEYPRARALFAEGLGLFREIGDRWGEASALLNLGLVSLYQDDLAEARTLYEASLAAFRQIGDKRSSAKLLGNLGVVAYYQGDYAAARPLYEESLAIRRELRDKVGIANQLDNLGYVALHQEEFEKARTLFGESLTLFEEIKNKPNIADVLCGLAGLAAAQGDPARAARLFGAGEALYEALGARVEVANRAEYDRGVAAARAQLDEALFEATRAEGRKMALEQAIAYALG